MSSDQIASTAVAAGSQRANAAGPTPASGILRRLLGNPVAVVCLVFLIIFIAIAVSAPLIAPYGPNFTNVSLTNAHPFTSSFVLGGDSSGRDILSRLIWGTRGTLLACLVVLVSSVVVGLVTGLLAGFYGGWVGIGTGWIFDVVLALPGTVLLIALYAVIGPSILTAMAIYGVLIAPSYYRLVRGVVAGVRQELYIDAARVAGLSDARIIFKHVLIAVRAPVIIQSAFVLAAGIGIQAGLEFLGLGDASEASWGGILQASFTTIYNNGGAVIAPTLVISAATLAFVLLGNALRDVLQVSSQQTTWSRGERQALRTVARVASPIHPEAMLEVCGLRIAYPVRNGVSEVVRGVDLVIHKGEIHGLVGESGSGKSQTAFAMLGILPRDALIIAGAIVFEGKDLLVGEDAMRAARGRRIAYVPQEPMSNLDATMTVGAQLTIGLRAVERISRADARRRLLGLLTRVGIREPELVFGLYPHQISGGMAQRVLIAGAIASDPDVIIADEPTTALDVTVQAEVLELLRELRDERGLGMLLVTHNLGVVADICDTVSVMREGLIVETGPVDDLFAHPTDEYTKALLAATLEA